VLVEPPHLKTELMQLHCARPLTSSRANCALSLEELSDWCYWRALNLGPVIVRSFRPTVPGGSAGLAEPDLPGLASWKHVRPLMRSLLDAKWAAVTAFAPDFIGGHSKSIAGPHMTELVPPAIQPSGLSHRSGQLRCAAVPRAVCIWASSAVSSGAAVRFAPLLPNARGFQHAVRARLLGNQHGRDHREPHEFRRGSAATIPVRDGRRRPESCGQDPQAPLSRGSIHRRRSAVSAGCSFLALTDRLS
jgi:hypothetical protein